LDASGLDAVFLFQSVDEDLHFAPDETFETLGGDGTLEFDDFRETILLDDVIDVVFVLHRSGTGLGRICERAHPIELGLLEKGQQCPKVIVRLAGESHEAGRANRKIGDRTAQPDELLAQRTRALGPAHPLQHPIARMLDRHVDVGNDTGLAPHQLHQPVSDAGRIDVEQTKPGNRRLAQQSLE
jgi:hypothetical protein